MSIKPFPLGPSKVVLSSHAVERFREHHPLATVQEVITAITQASECTGDAVMRLIGRWTNPHARYRYVARQPRAGMFVLQPRTDSRALWTVTTYLRDVR